MEAKKMRHGAATPQRKKRSEREQVNYTKEFVVLAVVGIIAMTGLIHISTHGVYWVIVNVLGNPHGWTVM